MASVQLIVDDPAQRMTLQAMLEAEGHVVGSENAEVIFTDASVRAHTRADGPPVIMLAAANDIPNAVRAMTQGAWGYVYLPLQPREATLAVDRAVNAAQAASVSQSAEPEDMKPLDEVELDYIQTVLRKCKHNQARAARVLGIGRNTLWRKLKKANPGTHGDAPD